MTTQVAPRKVQHRRALPVVAALEEHGLVDRLRHDDAVAVVDRALAGRVQGTAPVRRRMAELAGYVGGAFLVAAVALVVAEQWLDLPTVQQVSLLGGVATLMFGAGVALGVTGGGLAELRSAEQAVRRRLASVLFTAAAVAASAAVIVGVLDLLGEQEAERGHLVGFSGSLTLVVLAAVGYVLAPTLLGQLAVALGFAYLVPFTLDTVGEVAPIPLGLTYLGVGLAWLALAERGLWREVLPARIVGLVFVVVGAQIPITADAAWVAYLVTLAAGVAGFGVYIALRSWPYLAAGVAGVTLAVPEALLDWTEGTLGTAGVLLVAGVTLLGASVVGLRLRQEGAEPDASA